MRSRLFSSILTATLALGALSPAALAVEESAEAYLPEQIPEDAVTAVEMSGDAFGDDALSVGIEDVWEEILPEEAPAEAWEEEILTEEAPEETWEEEILTEEAPEEVWEEEILTEEAFTEEFSQEGMLALAEGDIPAGEAPVEEEAVYVDGLLADPEDPLYAKYVLQLDGAGGTYYYSDFTTRSLNNEVLRKGIDVSSWQGSINWSKVAAWGVEFAIIRCGYRGASTGKIMQDGRFIDYINGAKAAGLKVGVYIFSQALTVEEAVEEADFMLNLVKGYDIDLPLVFDLEHYPGGRFSNADLSARRVTDMCIAFCDRIEAAGYESMVYSNPSMLNKDMYPRELGRLWLAHYTTETGYAGRGYEYWQCTSSGIIDGIEGPVDMDFWFQPVQTGQEQESEPENGPFRDVREKDWFYDSVMQAYDAGVVKGVTETTFQPQGTATRGQVVTMIHRMADTPAYRAESAFTDLTQSYYKDAVHWAAEKGVVNGTSETTFQPDKTITRQELVTILYRMAESPAVDTKLDGYQDAGDIQSWAADAMAWAVENKIITGYEDMTLHPRANASRAEVCAILMRYAALSA